MERYELTPMDGRASFYRKAIVIVFDDARVLQSYDTIVMSKDENGVLHRHWDDWSATTGRHIYSFCGIRKKQWDEMPVEKTKKRWEKYV